MHLSKTPYPAGVYCLSRCFPCAIFARFPDDNLILPDDKSGRLSTSRYLFILTYRIYLNYKLFFLKPLSEAEIFHKWHSCCILKSQKKKMILLRQRKK